MNKPTAPLGSDANTAVSIGDAADPLAEGNSYNVTNAANPLSRTVHVEIRATLNDLCLQRNKGTWAPTPDALKAIFQQRKFTALDGSSEAQGDLKAVVLHNLEVQHVKSTFPLCTRAPLSPRHARTSPCASSRWCSIRRARSARRQDHRGG